MAKGPNPATANRRMLAGVERTSQQLNQSAARISAMKADPAYDHPAIQTQLDDQAAAIESKKAVVQAEISDRQSLDAAYLSKDKQAITKAKNDLAATRAGYRQYFGKSGSVSFCQPCLNKKLNTMKTVRRPQNIDAMIDQITGTFEGREPDYCAIADSPGDAGKLSYGKHQASETSGNLYAMLLQYSQNPNANPVIKAKIDNRLKQFSADHHVYDGLPADRIAFKSELKEAGQDPAMEATQDDFFRENFMKPALTRAADRCVGSPLGKSMFYDMSIQTSPAGNNKIASDAMTDLGYLASAKCQPCDPNGPTEAEYLKALNGRRRAYVTNIGGDAARSSYREDFFDDMLEDNNLSLDHDFVVKGVPVRGVPIAAPPAAASSSGDVATGLSRSGGGTPAAGGSSVGAGDLVNEPLETTIRRTTRGGEPAVRITRSDGSVIDISPARVKEYAPATHPDAPPGTLKKLRFDNAIPGSKGYKREPTPAEIEILRNTQ